MNAGLVAGSHNRNELVLIRHDDELGRPRQQHSAQICRVCGDEVGIGVDGEPFVACNECAFPLCKGCYEYERNEGTQLCPQCKTRLKRLKGNQKLEPIEEVTIEVNEEHVGLVMEALSHRRGEVVDMGPVPGDIGRIRLSLTCPSRYVLLSASFQGMRNTGDHLEMLGKEFW
ncbi:hypothetical protein ACFE04_017706 [Oxalis oulophora]